MLFATSRNLAGRNYITKFRRKATHTNLTNHITTQISGQKLPNMCQENQYIMEEICKLKSELQSSDGTFQFTI
jgi:hypothetical protein